MLIYVTRVEGKWTSFDKSGNPKTLKASKEQIHSALSQNGWVRINRFAEDDGVSGHYEHSSNWPLDQKPEPLAEFYA